MSSPLSIDYEPDTLPATATLHLRGVAGFREAAQLRRALFEAIEATGDKNLVVDLEALSRLDTAAMAVLVEGLMATRDRGPDLYLMCPSESVSKVFHLADLEEALTRCYDCWADFEQEIAV